jgi:hypothetical protein
MPQERAANRASLTAAVRDRHAHRTGGGVGVEAAEREDGDGIARAVSVPMSSGSSSRRVDGGITVPSALRTEPKKHK